MSDLLLARLSKNVSKNPPKNAIHFLSSGKNGGKLEREMTYEQVESETSALAYALMEKGLKKGDRWVSLC